MDEKQQKLLAFLLADFNAIKSEIARRSALQKASVVALLALYAWVFNKTLVGVEVVILTWGAAIIAALYVYREHREISRLGCLIKNNIAGQACEIIGGDKESLIPSEARASEPDCDGLNKFISIIFVIAIFFVVPLYFTIKHYYGT